MPILKLVYNSSIWDFDAAGLLTLLGVDEVNHAVGRLVRNRYLEFMPLLAPFVVTGNRFTEKIAGYHFYNLTNGISTEINSGWLVRYLISQEEKMGEARSILRIKVLPESRSTASENVCALMVSALFFGTLIIFTLLAGDFVGFVSTLGVIGSVFVRSLLVEANRRAIDASVIKAEEHHSRSAFAAINKALIVTRQNKCITVLIPGHLVKPLINKNPRVKMPRTYKTVRYLGWIAFFFHISSLDGACFPVQVIITASLILGTVLYSWKAGCTDSTWFWQRQHTHRLADGNQIEPATTTTFLGTRLKLELTEWPAKYTFTRDADKWKLASGSESLSLSRFQRHQDLYAWLQLSPHEETSMGKWNMLPHLRDSNGSWWTDYQAKKRLIFELGLTDHGLYTDQDEKSGREQRVLPDTTAAAVDLNVHASSKTSDEDGLRSPNTETMQFKGPIRTSTVLVEEGAITWVSSLGH